MSASGGGVNLGVAYASIEMNLDGLRSSMSQAKNIFSDGLQGIGDSISSAGQSMMQLGGNITALTAPLSVFGVAAISSASQFDESMTNIGAVMGVTREEITAIGNELQAFGEGTRAGPQSVADAFYDIVGGVTDATTHMAILEAANRTAEAGNADLGETTNAMISIMNSYGFSAEEAAFASDVLTRTVGAGVGTMGDFASALPQVTGLANAMGIEFDDLAAQAAYLTTQGNTASQAATQLGAMMTTLQNPTQALADVIHGLGYENGQALVDAKGLSGAYAEIRRAAGGSFDGIITNTEALRGATALASDTFVEFADEFTSAVDGSTVAAQAIQNQSFAAQLDLMKSAFLNLSITIGEAVLPALAQIMKYITPIIRGISAFATENPALVRTIGLVVGAVAALGAVLIPLGFAISTVGALMANASVVAFAAFLGPIALVGVALAGLYLAFKNNFLGVRDLLQPVVDRINISFTNITNGLDRLMLSLGWFVEDIKTFGIRDAILGAFGWGKAAEESGGESWLEGVIFNFGIARDDAIRITDQIGATVQRFLGIFDRVSNALSLFTRGVESTFEQLRLGDNIFDAIVYGLGQFVDQIFEALGFSEEAANGIQRVFFDAVEGLEKTFNRVVNTLRPLFTEVGKFLVNLFENIDFNQIFKIGQVLLSLTSPIGIATTVLRLFSVDVVSIFETVVNAVTRFFGAINDGGSFFDGLSAAIPGLNGFFDFLETAFSDVITFVTAVAIPGLQQFAEWFTTTALPGVITFLTGTVIPAIQNFFNFVGSIAAIVIPALQQFANWFLVDVLPQVITFVTGTIIPAIQSFFDFLGQIWAIAAPALMSLADWFLVSALPAIQQFISGVVIPFITDFIAVLVRIWNDVSPFLIQLFDWFVNTGLPLVISYINGVVIPAVQGFINILAGIWATVSPVLTQLYDWFIVTALPAIMTFIEGPMTTAIQGFITLLTGIWTAVSPGLQSLRDGFQGVFDWIKTNVIDPFLGVINDIVLRVQDAAYDVNNLLGRAEGMRPSDLAVFQESISGAGAFGAPAVIPGRALGGDVMGGMPYMVGEAGPELFIPGQSGSIVPNNALAQGAGGDNFNITIYAADGTDAANKFDNRLRELRRANG